MASELERRIRTDPEWQVGADWHCSEPGHPEPSVGDHIEEVLANVEEAGGDERLRIIAIVHDAFKHRVQRPWHDHARFAAEFARRYTDDPGILKVVERHDDAFRAWRFGKRTRLWPVARWRARRLIADLGPHLDLFRTFYRCDNETGDKSPDDRLWFEGLVEELAVGRDDGAA